MLWNLVQLLRYVFGVFIHVTRYRQHPITPKAVLYIIRHRQLGTHWNVVYVGDCEIEHFDRYISP